MSLPDPSASSAVLIGVSRYSSPDFTDLPAVAANVTDLHAVLTDAATGTLDADRCLVIQDPEDLATVARPLMEAASKAEDVFLVYYAGHGVRAGTALELYLPLATSGPDDVEWTGFPYRLIREAFRRTRATTKVAVLDCCYSGVAIQVGMSGKPDTTATGIIAQVDIAGTYVLTATPSYAQAMAPLGAVHTAFTGELIAALRDGVSGIQGAPRLQDVYTHLCAVLDAQGLPIPQQSVGNAAGNLILTRRLAPAAQGPDGDGVPDDVDEALTLIDAIGRGPNGDRQAALGAAQQLVRNLTVARGANHPDTINARITLVYWTGWAGNDHAKALAMAEQLVADVEREVGPTHPLVFRARLRVADHAFRVVGPDEAVRLTRSLLPEVETALGEEDETTRRCLSVHAWYLSQAGQSAEAATQHARLVALEERIGGPDSEKLPDLRWTLADYLGKAGEPEQAVAELRKAVSEFERIRGADHRRTLECREDMAYWLGAAGQVAEAVALRHALLADMTRVMGADDPTTLTTHENLACDMGQNGLHGEAADMFRAVIEARSRVLGAEHALTITSRENLANSLLNLGDAAGAAKLLQELVDVKGRTLGPDHPETLALRRDLAVQTALAGFPRAAMEMTRSIVEADTAALGARHEITLQDRISYGARASDSEDWVTAIATFEALIDDVGWAYGRDSRMALLVRSWHAQAVGYHGDTKRAADLLLTVLNEQRRVLGEGHEDISRNITLRAYFNARMPGPGFRPPMPPF